MKECRRCKINKEDSCFRVRHEKRSGGFYYLNSTCRECEAAIAAEYRAKKSGTQEFKQKNRDNANRYRLENPEKYRAKQKAKRSQEWYKKYVYGYYRKNRDKILEQHKVVMKKGIDELRDYYVVSKIRGKKAGVFKEDVPRELIELKKMQLQLCREIKNIQTNGTN